jgi:Flp pilus assembly protein TadD
VSAATDDIARLEAAVRSRPDDPRRHFRLASAWQAAGEYGLARQSYRTALMFDPRYREARNNLGVVLAVAGDSAAALAEFDALLAEMPDDSGVLANKGNALRDLGRFDAAHACFDAALAAAPGDARLTGNKALAYQHAGDPARAIALFRAAVEIDPNEIELQFNLAQALLLSGDFAEGLAAFEVRLDDPAIAARFAHLGSPRWDGADPRGKTILALAEQGRGDAIQFARFLPVLAARGARVVFAVAPPMIQLFRGLSSGVEIADADVPPDHDCHVPLLSLPYLLGADTLASGAGVPYLSAAPDLVSAWQKHLGAPGRLKVGLAWQGNPAYLWDRLRSIPPARLTPLFGVENADFFVLQKRGGAESAFAGHGNVFEPGAELDRDHAFVDTAAMMASLDLVISSDTAIAHLAGALGRPVWLLASSVPDWRWQLGREDSPWYPTMRLFRQAAPGVWDGAIEAAAAALREL